MTEFTVTHTPFVLSVPPLFKKEGKQKKKKTGKKEKREKGKR